MAKACGPMEKSEKPADEAREHSSSFLDKAARLGKVKSDSSRYGSMRKVGRAKSGR